MVWLWFLLNLFITVHSRKIEDPTKNNNSEVTQHNLNLPTTAANRCQENENSLQKKWQNINDVRQRLVELEKIANEEESKDVCNLARSTNLTTLSNGKKYFFSYPTQGNWSEAKKGCAERGLHLTALKNRIDLDAVYQKATQIATWKSWFLGAKNYGTKDKLEFRWFDGSKLEENDKLWADDADKKRGCVRIISSSSSFLLEATCSVKKNFICELPSECY
ncbi:uncharacterized protein LOC132193958 [Neocloeon triangulifer]|uniref:uncharacterized protein LOC132193958 n=1 Tax=Neocloeon triangulifer TaxID=2078957 RepID=UPI00286F2E7D|nr:uncharacterized protein LOC132193958 [Neocloeon triangulifer]